MAGSRGRTGLVFDTPQFTNGAQLQLQHDGHWSSDVFFKADSGEKSRRTSL
jgi:hypothetical protein